jgi:hypothetical protein
MVGDIDERIAFSHNLPFPVVHGDDNPVHLARNRRSENGRNRPDRIEVVADIALLRRDCRQCDRTSATSWRSRRCRGVMPPQYQHESDCKDDEYGNPYDDANAFVPGGSSGMSLIFRPVGQTCILISRQVNFSLAQTLQPDPVAKCPYTMDG